MSIEPTNVREMVEELAEMAKKHRIAKVEVQMDTIGVVKLEFRDDAFPPLEPAARVQPQTDEDRRKAEERHQKLRRYGSSRG